VRDENGDLLANSHNILNKWKKYFFQLLNIHRISDVRHKYIELSRFFFFCTAASPGLLCQPRVIVKMLVEKQMECRLAGETEVLRENLPQSHFCPSQNPT
jgi:hypothetical protein